SPRRARPDRYPLRAGVRPPWRPSHLAVSAGRTYRALGALVDARELCRQGAVVRHCRVDLDHEVAGGISQQGSHPASPLALNDEAPLVDHDIAPSAGRTARFLVGHASVRTVFAVRTRTLFRRDLDHP